MNQPRKKLADILANGNGDNFRNNWNTTAAADDFGPLPPGEYGARILSGELFTSKRNATPGYKLTCEVTAGDYEGRRLWLDFWLTPAALPMAKRDLAKIGVERPEQMEKPLPPGILLKVKVAVRRDDDGNETNKMTRFECIGVEPGDAFEPAGDDQSEAVPDAAFPFGSNAGPADDAAVGKASYKPDVNGAPAAGTNGAGGKPKRSAEAGDDAGTNGGPTQ